MLSEAERQALESELARVIGRASAETRRELLELLGNPPQAERLTAETWDVIASRYNGALLPQLERVYVASIVASSDAVGVAVAWDLVNERAVSWARQYSYELVRGINQTSRNWLGQAISDFYQGGLSYNDLITRVNTMFGPQRGASIAVTEVTRAATAGQMEYQRELNELGLRTVEVWQTANDAVTCPICGPRHGRKRGDGWQDPPPAHPRCRCWITIEVLTPEGQPA